MSNKLDCGHPAECLGGYDDEQECEWCEQVAGLRQITDDLRAHIDGKCIRLEPGDYTFKIGDPIGVLEMHSGSSLTMNTGADFPLIIKR